MAISYGTYTITEVQEGSQIWTSSAAPTTPNYTFDVSHLTGDSDIPIREGDIILNSYYRYTVLSISSDGTTVLTGNRTSIRGATGAASVTYALIVSNLAIVKDKDGNLSPSTITVTAKSQTGSNAMANYTGRIKIETTTNGTTWTTRSSEDLATKTYTIPSDTIAIRCSLYLKGGETTLLDQQTVPVVSDGTDGINGTNGKDGADGKDAYTIILTNENHTFAGNTTSAIASEIECNVIAYKGATQIAATIGTITGQPTGMTTSLLNNGTVNAAFKVNVTTSMVTKNGVLTVPITVDGKSFTKEFTYTLTLDGEKGDKGDRGTNGASQNLLLDAYAPSLAKVDASSARYFSDASNSTITGQFIAENNLPDPNATHFVRLTDSSASTKGRGLCFYSTNTPPFINGHTYRIGCWVRKHAGSPKVQITLGGGIGSWMPSQRVVDNTDWEWIETVRTFGDTDSNVTTQSDTYKRLYFYFYNNNVAGSSLDMCGFKMEEVQINSGTARNFLLGTEKLSGWGTNSGTTISDGIITFPYVSANTWREVYPAKNFKYNLARNQYAIFSIKVKGNVKEVDGELVGEKCCINLGIGVDTTETAYIRKKYLNQYVYFTGTGEWQTVCSAIPIFDYMFTSGTGTVDFDDCWVTVRIGAVSTYHNGFQAKESQLCLGTTATSWSPAPEDIEASAVTEEQYIYIQATSGTNSVSPKTEWVTEDGESTTSDTEGLTPQWTIKRPTYRSNYPVIFIAKQRKTVNGTVTCTTPTKDDTLTIIDGGHITTGTIDASRVNVVNINAESINTKSISIGDLEYGENYSDNLSPFFSHSPYLVGDYWQGWSNHNGYTYTNMGDGWMRVQYTNTTSSVVRRDFRPFVNRRIREGADYTFLIEFRNNHSTGNATGTDFYIVENNNCQFWGSAIKKNIEGAGNYTTTNIINNVPKDTTDIYRKRFIKVSEATGSSHWTGGSIDNVNGLVTFTTRCGANTTIDYEIRVSLYEGKYLGDYKPSTDSINGWSVLINVSAIDYLSNTATLHATVYKDGIVQTSGFTLQWYKTYTTTNITPEETTTQLITGATTDTLNITDLDASYTCIVS